MKTLISIIGIVLLFIAEGIYDSVYSWITWGNTGTVAIVLISFSWLLLSRNATRSKYGR